MFFYMYLRKILVYPKKQTNKQKRKRTGGWTIFLTPFNKKTLGSLFLQSNTKG